MLACVQSGRGGAQRRSGQLQTAYVVLRSVGCPQGVTSVIEFGLLHEDGLLRRAGPGRAPADRCLAVEVAGRLLAHVSGRGRTDAGGPGQRVDRFTVRRVSGLAGAGGSSIRLLRESQGKKRL